MRLFGRKSPPPIQVPDRLSRRFDLPRDARFEGLIPQMQGQRFDIVEHGWRSDAFLLVAARDGIEVRFDGEIQENGRWKVRIECHSPLPYPVGLVLEQLMGALGWKDHWIVELGEAA
jgi:hypothetical protein